MYRRTATFLVGFFIGTSQVMSQEPAAKPALKGLDPIELAKGKEVAGQEKFTAVHGRYLYWFASKDNQATFAKDPNRHAIQMAGACARMGPLSGAGNPGRFFVFDSRIYLFASDICRDNFKKNPLLHIDLPDAAPTGGPKERKQAQRLIDLALKGFGGADKVDAIKNLQTTLPRSYGAGKDKVDGTLTTTLAFPNLLRQDESWGKWTGSHALSGGKSFQRSGDDERPLEEVEREYLTRECFRHPLALLRARKQADFVAVATGKGKLGEREVDLLKIGVGGATSTLSIDPQTGQVRAIAYRGRPGMGPIGAMERTYSDFKSIDGVVLPHAVRTTWEGKLLPTYSGGYSAVRISVDLDVRFFGASPPK